MAQKNISVDIAAEEAELDMLEIEWEKLAFLANRRNLKESRLRKGIDPVGGKRY